MKSKILKSNPQRPQGEDASKNEQKSKTKQNQTPESETPKINSSQIKSIITQKG